MTGGGRLPIVPGCPYCGGAALLTDGTPVYGHDRFGPVWVCANHPTCDAYVGCHKGTQRPLGRLADAELRAWKMRAHNALDPIWKRKVRNSGIPRNQSRGLGYKWLARQLGIPAAECHIGMFDVELCRRAVDACRPYLRPGEIARLEGVAACQEMRARIWSLVLRTGPASAAGTMGGDDTALGHEACCDGPARAGPAGGGPGR
jgi:hypothetical protein